MTFLVINDLYYFMSHPTNNLTNNAPLLINWNFKPMNTCLRDGYSQESSEEFNGKRQSKLNCTK
jgi:hypothetical protein